MATNLAPAREYTQKRKGSIPNGSRCNALFLADSALPYSMTWQYRAENIVYLYRPPMVCAISIFEISIFECGFVHFPFFVEKCTSERILHWRFESSTFQ